MSLRVYLRTHRFALSLAAIALAGLTLRIVYTVLLRHHPVTGDGLRYHYGALCVVDGHGFVSPLNRTAIDAGHPPGWTVVLAAPTSLGLRTWLEHGIFADFIGTATIVMTGMAARAAFGKRIGLIAATLAAAYPFFWIYEREVLSEPLAMLFIATVIWLAYKFLAAPSRSLAIALGATVGALAMTKSDQIAIAVVLVAPLILWRRNIDLRRRVGWLATAAVVCAAVMAPWSIYLSSYYHRPVLLTGAVGATMAAGNCAPTYQGELLGWYVFGCGVILKNPPADPFTKDAKLRKRALTFMRDHESRAAVVMVARVGRTFGFFRPFQQVHLELSSDIQWVGFTGLFAYWALLPLGVVGAVVARRRKIPIYPLLVFPVVVVFTVLLTIGSVRYRAPAEIPLVMLAAVGIDAILGAWQRRSARSR